MNPQVIMAAVVATLLAAPKVLREHKDEARKLLLQVLGLADPKIKAALDKGDHLGAMVALIGTIPPELKADLDEVAKVQGQLDRLTKAIMSAFIPPVVTGEEIPLTPEQVERVENVVQPPAPPAPSTATGPTMESLQAEYAQAKPEERPQIKERMKALARKNAGLD